ncbi:hypothetical protein Q7533_07535 [Glaesserella parasuis]|nr:hypothetical protein [Glaesserella parasuis]
MMVGAADTAISTKIEGKENYLKEQKKYLKSSAISEIINSNPYLQKHPLGDVIKVINSEMINEVVDDGGNK